MTTSLLVTTALHFVLLYHYATTYWFYLTDTKERMYAARLYTFGGEYKYLTIWTMLDILSLVFNTGIMWGCSDLLGFVLLQLFYFFWCCVTDLISASASETSVGKVAVAVRDWFLAAVVFPIGTLVVTTFWAIYAVDRELIFPEALDKFFPSWLNHALHTYVLPLLLVDMLLVNHKYPSRRAGMAGTLAFGFSYLIWILFLGFAKDIWVYPFFKVLHGVYFPIFFATMSLILIMFYIIGEKTNALLGGYKKEVSTEKID